MRKKNDVVPMRRFGDEHTPWAERGSADLRAEHRADLRASDLGEYYIDSAAGDYFRSDPEGLIFVYRSLEGEPLGDYGRIKLFPARTRSDGKLQRYDGDQGSHNRLYLPYGLAALLRKTKVHEINFAEGEKKGSCLVANDIPAAAFSGVWNFLCKDPETKESRPCDEFEALKPHFAKLRPVIAFDSDIWANINIQKAALRALEILREISGRGDVGIRLLPPVEGEREGVDDFIRKHGAKAYLALPVLAPDAAELASFGIPQDLNPTDMGNAARFAARHSDRVRYCHSSKTFYLWDGVRWNRDEKEEVVQLAAGTARSIYNEAARTTDPDRRQALAKWASASEAAPRLRAMVDLGRTVAPLPVTAEKLDSHAMLLGVKNGVIDLTTGKLLAPDPARLMTKSASVAFDPDAECPTFERFVLDVMAGDESLVAFVRRACGYALTGVTKEHAFFVLWGAGANGKSTLIQVLLHVLGDYGTTTGMETWLASKNANGGGPSENLVRLKGVRFVASSEADEDQRLAESRVKEVTGGDRIAARGLYQSTIMFTPQFKIFLTCNHRPVVRGDDPAVWRRLKLIPFGRVFAAREQDRDLPSKLMAEAPGVLAWMVRGCLEWQRLGLAEPETITAATSAYRDDSDVFNQFLRETTEPDARAAIATRDLYASFRAWSLDNGTPDHCVMTRNKFTRRLTNRGFKTDERDTSNNPVVKGLKFLDSKKPREKKY